MIEKCHLKNLEDIERISEETKGNCENNERKQNKPRAFAMHLPLTTGTRRFRKEITTPIVQKIQRRSID